MKTTQAWGWLAAGVVALGLNGFCHDGGAEWAHQIVDRAASRSEIVLVLASGRADQFLARAQTVAARQETQSCRLATTMARLQTRMSRERTGFAQVEAMSAREEAAFARLEANRARIEAQVERVRFVPAQLSAMRLPVICPRVRMNVSRIQIAPIEIPDVDIPAVPAVEVETGADPI
ncbi:MAG: hypothetical protein WB562_16110 [Candidatus Sulfotelmatobacter sp.]